jgi:hypothetical protein
MSGQPAEVGSDVRVLRGLASEVLRCNTQHRLRGCRLINCPFKGQAGTRCPAKPPRSSAGRRNADCIALFTPG